MAASIRPTIRTSPPTDIPRGTTHGPAPMDEAREFMARMVAPVLARAITHAPERTLAVRRPTDRTARAASRRRTTRAPEPTRRPGRAPTCTAAGDRRRFNEETTGQ